MPDNDPYLLTVKTLKNDYEKFSKINLTNGSFTLGRALSNSVTIPFIAISRNHCIFRKNENNEWLLEDQSSFGITINGDKLGKGAIRKLVNEDVIELEPSSEFVYKFVCPEYDDFEIPRKRIKLEKDELNILNNVKLKFEESQSYEIKHIEEKIQNAKQMQTTQMILKEQLESDLNRKIQQLESNFAEQIENLKGEKNEVERQKAALLEERDCQLSLVREEMEGKITELMEQIEKHNETESELLKENNLLKEKLLKEREDFLAELNRENTSKQEMLDKLNEKMREQEEMRQKEKEELEEMLRKENELLRLAKEEEIRTLEEQKKQREQELIQELDTIKKNLEAQVEQSLEQQRKAEQELANQMEEMKKLNNEDKVKMEQLMKEREEIENKLIEAQTNAEKTLEEARAQVNKREIELGALASESIQQQADQSSEVISSLQAQLEKMRSQLQSIETEKNVLLESLGLDSAGEGTSKQSALAEVGELMESELQCSICAELFIEATTLNCSHTFCKYCITMWKKKKKDCPICRSNITSECKSLVLDSFIEKMVQNLTEDMKKKREELLKARKEVESELASTADRNGRRGGLDFDPDNSEIEELSDELVEEEYEEFDDDNNDYQDYDDYIYFEEYSTYRRRRLRYAFFSDTSSDDDSDGGSDGDSDPAPAPAPATVAAAGAATAATAAVDNTDTASGVRPTSVSDNTTERTDGASRRRSRRIVPGLPGSVYGGYGRCYYCGARGHWAPGCPNR